MSGVERVGYMDNIAAASLTESIVKEKKIQREYFKKQEAAGSIVAKPPTPTTFGKSALETVGVPPHVTAVLQDPERSIALSTSKSMWMSNPGYIVRDGPRTASQTHKDFVYDQEEVDFMKAEGYLDKKHNRRRDEFVMYVEAHAKMQLLIKGPGGAGAH